MTYHDRVLGDSREGKRKRARTSRPWRGHASCLRSTERPNPRAWGRSVLIIEKPTLEFTLLNFATRPLPVFT